MSELHLCDLCASVDIMLEKNFCLVSCLLVTVQCRVSLKVTAAAALIPLFKHIYRLPVSDNEPVGRICLCKTFLAFLLTCCINIKYERYYLCD